MTNSEAAVLVGPGEVEVRQFPLPVTGPGEGLLEVEASGICGSDIEPFLRGGAPVGAYRTIETPVILGHETVGIIADIGAEASARWGVTKGDRVVVERWLPCWRCAACQQGAFPYCVRHVDGKDLFYGGTPTTVAPSLWGGFARHMYLHPDSVLHRVPRLAKAGPFTMFLPLANAVDWVLYTGKLAMGDSILIEGPGPIGLIAVMVARAAGARSIVVSGTSSDGQRLELARELGATATLVVGDDNVAGACKDAVGGEGVDLVLDVSSAPDLSPVVTAVEAARPSGRIVLATDYANEGGAARVLSTIQHKTLAVTGVRGRSRRAAAAALDLLGDPAWVDRLHRLSQPVVGLDGVAEGFRALRNGEALHASVAPAGQASH